MDFLDRDGHDTHLTDSFKQTRPLVFPSDFPADLKHAAGVFRDIHACLTEVRVSCCLHRNADSHYVRAHVAGWPPRSHTHTHTRARARACAPTHTSTCACLHYDWCVDVFYLDV
jgi:hypothetical protein